MPLRSRIVQFAGHVVPALAAAATAARCATLSHQSGLWLTSAQRAVAVAVAGWAVMLCFGQASVLKRAELFEGESGSTSMELGPDTVCCSDASPPLSTASENVLQARVRSFLLQ